MLLNKAVQRNDVVVNISTLNKDDSLNVLEFPTNGCSFLCDDRRDEHQLWFGKLNSMKKFS